MTNIEQCATYIRDQAAAFCAASNVPGFLAGVSHGDAETVVAHGLANISTGAAMRADTGFLMGSITKIMTTMLVLQQVERGRVDLDERVVAYVPEFTLTAPDAAAAIKVRHLLTHTNGIDADFSCPDAAGRDALKLLVDLLGKQCGALFEPGEYMSYSNGGMNVAGRLLEVVTGESYHDLLEREIYATVGMRGASTSAEQAILQSTAVGHFPDMATMAARRTSMFKLPDTWAPAGASPIATVEDLLALGRTHLAGGVSPQGTRVLSAESIAAMRTQQFDMGTPNVPPVGLGWLLMPFGHTTVLSHSGASPGGAAMLAVVPDHDLIFAAFANDMRGVALMDQILSWLLREHLGVSVPDLIEGADPVADLTAYEGTYRSDQMRVDVRAVDGQLEERTAYEPFDAEQERIFAGFSGGMMVAELPPRRYVSLREGLFAPAGMPLQAFNGYSRNMLVSYHGMERRQAALRCAGGRMSRRREG